MKIRELILDFTSLLDVIMIILFWFILNYQTETTKIREKANAAEAAAVEARIIAEEREQEAADLRQTAQDELDALAQVNERQASILGAMADFRQGRSVNLKLVSRPQYWYLDVSVGEEEHLGQIFSDDEKRLGMRINEMLADAGFAPDATVLCVLSYDSTEPGSYDAYNSVKTGIRSIQLGNPHFSCTEIDRAVPEEETP